jgi:hypothetical protein
MICTEQSSSWARDEAGDILCAESELHVKMMRLRNTYTYLGEGQTEGPEGEHASRGRVRFRRKEARY